MRTTVRVIQGRLTESEPHRRSAIEAAYQHFRLDKQGSLVSPKTLQHYESTIRPFLRWLDEEYPEVLRFEQLGVDMVRQYRVDISQRLTTRGRLPEPATLNDLHRLLMTPGLEVTQCEAADDKVEWRISTTQLAPSSTTKWGTR